MKGSYAFVRNLASSRPIVHQKGQPGLKLSTARFAQLLVDAQAWDSRYQAMCHAQTEWLLENFCFGDCFCVYVDLERRRAWDIPKVAGRHLFTICR